MNFVDPIGTLIGGANGRVLRALVQIDGDIPLGRLGKVANVSVNRVSEVVNHLAELGLVDRRDVPPTALISLNRHNVVSKLLIELAQADKLVVAELARLAKSLRPKPIACVVYGSFARQSATQSSDIDVALVADEETFRSDAWASSLNEFVDKGTTASGNRVSVVTISTQDIKKKRVTKSFLNEIVNNQIVLAGRPVAIDL